MFYIYKIENKLNQKKYIGLTTRNIEKRWHEHIDAAYSNTPAKDFALHKAIRKYGENNFTVEQIDTANDEEELKEKEIYYIQYYNSYIKNDCGYNMTLGGDLNLHLKGELSPVSILSDSQRFEIISLLKNTDLTFIEIAERVGLEPNTNNQKNVSMINTGENFHQKDLSYPIRKNSRSISKTGEKNPQADIEKVKKVIDLLINTNYTQQKIADICKVHYNTVNQINLCKRWTDLHHYKNNIRQECGRKAINDKIEEKVILIIKALEEGWTSEKIRETYHTSLNMISNINNCRCYTYLHSYQKNIRKESRGD